MRRYNLIENYLISDIQPYTSSENCVFQIAPYSCQVIREKQPVSYTELQKRLRTSGIHRGNSDMKLFVHNVNNFLSNHKFIEPSYDITSEYCPGNIMEYPGFATIGARAMDDDMKQFEVVFPK